MANSTTISKSNAGPEVRWTKMRKTKLRKAKMRLSKVRLSQIQKKKTTILKIKHLQQNEPDWKILIDLPVFIIHFLLMETMIKMGCILIPIKLVPNFTHRGRLVIRGRCCSFSQPSVPLGYKQTVSRGRWEWSVQTEFIFWRHLWGKFGIDISDGNWSKWICKNLFSSL